MADRPFERVVVATDFSEPAAAAMGRAVWLAERNGSEVLVAHVLGDLAFAVPGNSFEAHWVMPPAELHKAERRLRRQAKEELDRWVAPHRRTVRRLRTEVLAGSPYLEIIRLVQREGADLVLAGTRGLGRFRRMLVGSTAERLVRHCPCPVWVARPEHEWPLHSILAPVDFSEASVRSARLAAALARQCECPLTVLHAFLVPNWDDADGPAWRRRTRAEASEQLSQFVHRFLGDGIAVQQRLGVGLPGDVIRNVAARVDAGLIVLGTAGRSGIRGLVIGNTAERVLRACDRSILAIKPPGCAAPVPAETERPAAIAGHS